MIPAGSQNISDLALLELAKRLKYYPIIQVVTRFLVTFNDFYGYTSTNWDDDADTAPRVFAFQTSSALMASLTSVGYLLIFIWSQPEAYKHLKIMFAPSSALAVGIGSECKQDRAKGLRIDPSGNDSAKILSFQNNYSEAETTKAFLMQNPLMHLDEEELFAAVGSRKSEFDLYSNNVSNFGIELGSGGGGRAFSTSSTGSGPSRGGSMGNSISSIIGSGIRGFDRRSSSNPIHSNSVEK